MWLYRIINVATCIVRDVSKQAERSMFRGPLPAGGKSVASWVMMRSVIDVSPMYITVARNTYGGFLLGASQVAIRPVC